MTFVRQCEKCGHVDDRETWSSAAEAADSGAFRKWTCPSCAWSNTYKTTFSIAVQLA